MAALEIDVPHYPDHLRIYEWQADFQSESAQTYGDVCPYRHLLCFCGDDLPGSGKTILNSPLYRRDNRVLEGGRPKLPEISRLA